MRSRLCLPRHVHLGRGRVRPKLLVMGFNKPTWAPGRERHRLAASDLKQIDGLRHRRRRQALERLAARELEASLLSLAALLGSSVTDPAGDTVGELRDVVVNWTSAASYPPMTSIVMRAGGHDVLIGARWIDVSPPASVRLRSSDAYARAVERRPADVELAHDVLDHQVVDSAGTQIVRPSDVYLAAVNGRVEAVGIEVGAGALLRRLGPKRLRGHLRPAQVIDWRDIASFAPARDGGKRPRGRRSDIAGQPGSGLALGAQAADVKRHRPSELRDALKSYKTAKDRDVP
jgi:sporulation protein YlmC with PRC-barrel domain